MLEHVDNTRTYKTQWKAYYKPGLMSPRIVYGESEAEARINALAEYRKNKTMVDIWPIEKVVDHVDWIG